MSDRKTISIVILCVLLPAAVIAGHLLTGGKQYLLLSLVIITASCLPFFLALERKKLRAGELVIMASVIALSAASRAAFFFLPQVKPMCALLIIAAVSFGAEFGFVSGALSMLVSNLIFGQGMWTPFQMLGMGITVFAAALIIRASRRGRFFAGAVSGAACFVLYGAAADLGSVFMMVSEFNIRSVLSVYLSGVPFNLIHGTTTAVVTALLLPEISEKLDRIKIKYGMFGEKL